MDRMIWAWAAALGFLLDWVLGDPQFLYHPVRLIGWLIGRLETVLRKICKKTEKGLLLGGLFLVAAVCGITGGAVWALLALCREVSVWLYLAVSAVLCYQLLAARSLQTESMKVYQELKKGDLPGARRAVSMIVGRDTERLSEAGVTKAAVETVAENTSDGVIAPLFYLALGGPVLGWVYKAVNTMDSMVGYKNEAYLYFGRAAAKLDDLANFLPARLSAGLMVLAAAVLGMDWREGMHIFFRDRFNHASPNSAQTEAVCAGVLHVQLAGDACILGPFIRKRPSGMIKGRWRRRISPGPAVSCTELPGRQPWRRSWSWRGSDHKNRRGGTYEPGDHDTGNHVQRGKELPGGGTLQDI